MRTFNMSEAIATITGQNKTLQPVANVVKPMGYLTLSDGRKICPCCKQIVPVHQMILHPNDENHQLWILRRDQTAN